MPNGKSFWIFHSFTVMFSLFSNWFTINVSEGHILWRALYSTMESYPLKTLPFIVLKHLPKWWKTWPRQFFCGGQLAIFTSVSSTNPKSSLHRPGGWLSLNSSSPFQVPKMKSVVERTCSPFLIENFMIQSRPGHSSVPKCFCFLHCGTV